MRRREFIAALSAAAALPISAHAQQPLKIWRIGVLESATRELNIPNMNVFLKTLREYGYIEGENLVIEYRSTGGRNERLPELVSELMRLKVNLMLVRGTPEILAVKKATSTIPVVMLAVADPVGLGVAASLSHPGGNITGMDSFTTELEAKRLGLLK
jgi:putative ABC transport system substrate-binding protein